MAAGPLTVEEKENHLASSPAEGAIEESNYYSVPYSSRQSRSQVESGSSLSLRLTRLLQDAGDLVRRLSSRQSKQPSSTSGSREASRYSYPRSIRLASRTLASLSSSRTSLPHSRAEQCLPPDSRESRMPEDHTPPVTAHTTTGYTQQRPVSSDSNGYSAPLSVRAPAPPLSARPVLHRRFDFTRPSPEIGEAPLERTEQPYGSYLTGSLRKSVSCQSLPLMRRQTFCRGQKGSRSLRLQTKTSRRKMISRGEHPFANQTTNGSKEDVVGKVAMLSALEKTKQQMAAALSNSTPSLQVRCLL